MFVPIQWAKYRWSQANCGQDLISQKCMIANLKIPILASYRFMLRAHGWFAKTLSLYIYAGNVAGDDDPGSKNTYWKSPTVGLMRYVFDLMHIMQEGGLQVKEEQRKLDWRTANDTYW